MSGSIKTYEEWVRNPSYHGSYDDYARQMRAMEALRQRESEDEQMTLATLLSDIADELEKERRLVSNPLLLAGTIRIALRDAGVADTAVTPVKSVPSDDGAGS